nr:HAMP domain-containing protein [Desulfobulbaceae bacterium]
MKNKHIDRQQIAHEIIKLREIVSSHSDQEDLAGSAEKASHDMMHKAIRTMSLSEYIMKQSVSGWQDADLEEVSELIRQELTSLGPILDQHLKIHLTELGRAEAYVSDKYRSARIFVWSSIVIMSILVIGILVLMMRSILGPVRVLQEGAKRIGDGNLDYDLVLSSGDELEFLAQEFNDMAKKLSVSYSELDRKVKERTRELSGANAELKREIIERKTAQEEQMRAEEQIHILSQELLKIQESERQQISLDLHDNVAQELSALKVAGESIWSELHSDEDPLRQQIHEWEKMLDRCVKTVRELSYNLRPPGLEQIGLASAVSDYCRGFSKNSGIAVNFSTAGIDSLQLDYTYAINIYRLIQEALNNIHKHAQATTAEIKLTASHPNIILRIDDDGKGFDVEEGYLKAQHNKRLGLLGMQERVRMYDGVFHIQSRLNKGTKIRIEIPWSSTNADH